MSWSRAFRPDRWQRQSLTIAAIVGGSLVASHFAKAMSSLDPERVDFAILYGSVRRWWGTGVLYDPRGVVVNYNAPQFHLLIMPLAHLPLCLAFIAWTIVTIACAVATLGMIVRESDMRWSQQEVRVLVAAVLLSAGTGAVVHLGQVGWVVALMTTVAWRSARRSQWRAAGLWVGVAAALKPFLVVVLLVLGVRRKWHALAFAAIAILASFSVGAVVFGADSVRTWVALLRAGAPTQQVAYFINASAIAILARAGGGPLVSVGVGVLLVTVTLWAACAADEDTAWAIALTCAILASPLGWIYYLPLLTAPMAAASKRGHVPGVAWIVWPLLAFPAISRGLFLSTPVLAVSFGSIYSWGLLFLWIAVVLTALLGPRDGSPPQVEWQAPIRASTRRAAAESGPSTSHPANRQQAYASSAPM